MPVGLTVTPLKTQLDRNVNREQHYLWKPVMHLLTMQVELEVHSGLYTEHTLHRLQGGIQVDRNGSWLMSCRVNKVKVYRQKNHQTHSQSNLQNAGHQTYGELSTWSDAQCIFCSHFRVTRLRKTHSGRRHDDTSSSDAICLSAGGWRRDKPALNLVDSKLISKISHKYSCY